MIGHLTIRFCDRLLQCGRGGLTNHHKGNKRFRDIVALHRPDYVRAPKIQKPSVARVIVRAIRNGDPPGRFLRKDERSGKWIDIGMCLSLTLSFVLVDFFIALSSTHVLPSQIPFP